MSDICPIQGAGAGGVHSAVEALGEIGDRQAAPGLLEALQVPLPSLRAYPQAFGGLAKYLLENYLRACEQSGQPPDAALA